VLNQLFRDAALNAITAIRARIAVVREGDGETRERNLSIMHERATELEADVEEMSRLTRGASAGDTRLSPVELVTRLEDCIAAAGKQFPESEIAVTAAPPTARVWATDTLEDAFAMAIESAVARHPEGAPRIEIEVVEAGGSYRVEIADDGPALPPGQRRLLADESDDEVVDPTAGFGLHVAELLVESYRGELTATTIDGGTTVAVELASAEDTATPAAGPVAGPATSGVTRQRLALAGCMATVAGVLMSLVSEALGGSVPIIGVLYGAVDPLVEWTTHLFHKVVFGLIYAGILAAAPARFDGGHVRRIAGALVWAVVLWLVAAGVVMPFWIQLVGAPATVATLAVRAFVTHLVWGAVLGTLYTVGRTWLDARTGEQGAAEAPTPSA
jgi:hypothetical protein